MSRERLRAVLSEVARQRQLGRAYQPSFARTEVVFTWVGALLALSLLSLLSAWSAYPLTAAPLGASSVLLFGYPRSPLAQPRNIVLGNTTAALVSVALVGLFDRAPWVIGLAVGLTIALGQLLRCLHPPAGGVAFLGVLLKARLGFALFPVLSGSVLLVLMAVAFNHWVRPAERYPRHWL